LKWKLLLNRLTLHHLQLSKKNRSLKADRKIANKLLS